jgi:hypothetical protein
MVILSHILQYSVNRGKVGVVMVIVCMYIMYVSILSGSDLTIIYVVQRQSSDYTRFGFATWVF